MIKMKPAIKQYFICCQPHDVMDVMNVACPA